MSKNKINYDHLNDEFQIYINLIKEYKGVYIELENNQSIFVKFNGYDLKHMLGFDRIKNYKKIKGKSFYSLLKKKKIKWNLINKKSCTNRNDKNIIHSKINGFIQFIDFIRNSSNGIYDLNKIELNLTHGKFRNYDYDGILIVNKKVAFVIEEDDHPEIKPNFNSYHIISLRDCTIDKKYKDYSKSIIKIKSFRLSKIKK